MPASLSKLFFGDNLAILREHVADDSVDLIYLDPPFNSKRDYNLLFKTPKGHESDAQITAFEDTWHWGEQAQNEFRDILKGTNAEVAEMMQALRRFLGENDLMAYLTIMANRLIELHRVLKPTGSLYLHCDATASHYLRLLMDVVFGGENFRNEIHWYYYNKMHDRRKKCFPQATDSLLFYAKDVKADFTFHQIREMRDAPVRQLVRKKVDGKMVNARDAEGHLMYQVKEDRTVDNVWRIPMLQPASPERLGYPTQKPVALLERIISASSNEGDVVLDPFCGCGTALDAAEKLKRHWIGIDITHLAISLIEKRLKQRYPALQEKGAFEVHGVPQDIDGARDLAARDKHQFQLWACSLVGVQPYKGGKKGADQGVDGLGFIEVSKGKSEKVLVSVKGGENINASMVRDLKGTVDREKAAIGLFVTLAKPSKPMLTEAASSGHYESPHHGPFARIQILTIEGLLDGSERPRWPDMSYGGATFKTAKAHEGGDQAPLFTSE